MKKVLYILTLYTLIVSCGPASDPTSENASANDFSFVFLTDIHLTTERHALEGFMQAIDTINHLNPDFVLTGGDNIMDALAENYEHSDSLYDLFAETAEKLKMPINSTMGNHEVFGLYESSGIDPTHKEFGKKFYENRLANRYYSFNHKNWHFIVLDAIGLKDDRTYFGHIDAEQMEWLKNDLEQTGKETPIVVSTHIPLLSIGAQVMEGPTKGIGPGSIVTNATEVRELLEQYNTKLVLQGHLHFLEDINYNGIHYITGGAISAQWWQGPRFGMEEGFLKIDISGEDFDWNYIDFGWEVKNETATN